MLREHELHGQAGVLIAAPDTPWVGCQTNLQVVRKILKTRRCFNRGGSFERWRVSQSILPMSDVTADGGKVRQVHHPQGIQSARCCAQAGKA